jgi:hypothetical protein
MLQTDEADVWYVPGGGFVAIGVTTWEESNYRELRIHAIAGVRLIGPELRESFAQLAKQEGCGAVWCKTRRRALSRMLKRLGYVVDDSDAMPGRPDFECLVYDVTIER